MLGARRTAGALRPAPTPAAERVVVVLSGGMDSTVLLAELLDRGCTVLALSVDYGQRHVRELDAARRICRHYGVEHLVADLGALRPLLGASALTDRAIPVPHGHYADASMRATVVPNRNMLLLATAIAVAIARDCPAVAYGAHAGDHAVYPDCRPEFAVAMERAAALCHYGPVKLRRPFVAVSKAAVAARGAALGVPFALTWSCYEGGAVHCGQCGTCVERREAFEIAGVPDPTTYDPA